jgi:hypothetical protein
MLRQSLSSHAYRASAQVMMALEELPCYHEQVSWLGRLAVSFPGRVLGHSISSPLSQKSSESILTENPYFLAISTNKHERGLDTVPNGHLKPQLSKLTMVGMSFAILK